MSNDPDPIDKAFEAWAEAWRKEAVANALALVCLAIRGHPPCTPDPEPSVDRFIEELGRIPK